jgi:hypothetical protein
MYVLRCSTQRQEVTNVPGQTSGVSMYEYDAFFSYKRNRRSDGWHLKLVESIKFWLSEDLAKSNARIFIDNQSIENGLLFDRAIARALNRSAVIISVFSPLYFTSDYCLAEIDAFMKREDHLGADRGSLISCARFHDGDSYPLPYLHMQQDDFSPFANPTKAFWESNAATQFEELIRSFTHRVADKIKAAPPWSQDFPDPVYAPNCGTQPPRIMRPSEYLGAASP